MKINKLDARHWLYLAIQALHTIMAIVLRPFLRKPESPIVLLYGHQFSGHLAALHRQWRNVDATDLQLYFLSLNPRPVLITSPETVDVLYCHRLKDMLLVSRASAIITDHGLHTMFPLVHLTDITFIDVGHGIPFKGYDQDDFRLQHNYTEIWTSSSGISDLYARQCGCQNLVYSIGSPRTDKLIDSRSSSGEFRTFAKIPPRLSLVLYAPTWQQESRERTLIPFDQNEDDFLRSLNDFCWKNDCVLVFRCHQNTSFNERNLERIIFCPQVDYPDTETILKDTDVLISDWSSIVFDFLVLDRPTVFLDVPHPFAKGCTLGPEYRFGHVASSMDDALSALERYIREPRRYLQEHGERHYDVKAFVYDHYADGQASQRCLERLQNLLTR